MSDLAATTTTVASTAYPDDPQITIGFEPNSIAVLNKSSTAADIVHVSFDGAVDHGTLIPGLTQGLSWDAKRTKLWFRLQSAGSVDVLTMANTRT